MSAKRDTPPQQEHPSPGGAPKAERWFQVMLVACVPVLAALALPRSLLWPMTGVSAVLFVVGLVMFLSRPPDDSEG